MEQADLQYIGRASSAANAEISNGSNQAAAQAIAGLYCWKHCLTAASWAGPSLLQQCLKKLSSCWYRPLSCSPTNAAKSKLDRGSLCNSGSSCTRKQHVNVHMALERMLDSLQNCMAPVRLLAMEGDHGHSLAAASMSFRLTLPQTQSLRMLPWSAPVKGRRCGRALRRRLWRCPEESAQAAGHAPPGRLPQSPPQRPPPSHCCHLQRPQGPRLHSLWPWHVHIRPHVL